MAREIRGLFKPADCYHPKYHKFHPDPLTQISNAYNRKVDSAEYWHNRTYYSRLYQSLYDAKIAQGDIQTIWGSPYVIAAINWDTLPHDRQQAIRCQHPEIDGVAKGIACARSDFATVLSKTAPETHRFVNEFAIPMAALANQPKPSPLADTARRVVSATVNACHKYDDFTERAWEIGWLHSVFDDDTLLNETERQQFKAWIIDREMRPKSGNFTEVFNAVLNVAEITGIATTGKIFRGTARVKPALEIAKPLQIPAKNAKLLGQFIEIKTPNGQTIVASRDSFMTGIANRTGYTLEQIGLTREGKLSPALQKKIFEDPKCAMKTGDELRDPKIINALTTIDCNRSNWIKFTIESTKMPNGGKYQIHGYANKATKEVVYSDINPKTGAPVDGLGLKIKINLPDKATKKGGDDPFPASLFKVSDAEKAKALDEAKKGKK